MTDSDNIPMFIIDVLRHGGGATFAGLLKRLNDFDCIGWRDSVKSDFTADLIRPILKEMIHSGLVQIEDLNTQRPVPPISIAEIEDSDTHLIENTEKAQTLWEQWTPPKNMKAQPSPPPYSSPAAGSESGEA